MPVIIIAIVGFLIGLAALQRNGGHARNAFAWAFIGVFGLTAGLTEMLSLARAINLPAVLGAWLATALVAVLVFRPRFVPRAWLTPISAFSKAEKTLLFLTGTSVLVLLAIALAAPPTNADAYSYHLPRVYRWITQGSVQFLPTADERQNVYQPLAEFMILHLRLLSGSDRLFNLVQWSALVASIIFVSLLAREIGLNRRGQLLAACMAVTIPMAVLQATSCQNDLIAASFCLALAYGLIRLTKTGTTGAAVFCGLALGIFQISSISTH